jgi:hypothetical protein
MSEFPSGSGWQAQPDGVVPQACLMRTRLFMVRKAIALDARLWGRRSRSFSPGNALLLLGTPAGTTPPLRGTPPQRGMPAV